jgi:ElaB/YqjD/DUF883 family membrane-anchored ribosome-binding protein
MPSRSRLKMRKQVKKKRVRAARSYREQTPSLSSEGDLAREEKELKEMKTIDEILRDLKKSLETNLPQLREQVKAVQEKARRTTTERPMVALGVAFLMGLALGIALSRSKDQRT